MSKLLTRVALAFALVSMLTMGASAQSTADEYALSEEVTEYTVDGEQLLEFSNVTDEDNVEVELLNNEDVQDTVDGDINSDGELQFSTGEEDVDQIAVYPEDDTFDAEDIDEVTHNYDLSTDGNEGTPADYNESQDFIDFTVEEVADATSLLEEIFPWLIVLAFMGAAFRSL